MELYSFQHNIYTRPASSDQQLRDPYRCLQVNCRTINSDQLFLPILPVFRRNRKLANIDYLFRSSCHSYRPSVYSLGRTWLKTDKFPWNFIFQELENLT